MWWAKPISGKFIHAVVLAMALSNASLNLNFSFWDKRVTLFRTLFLFPCFLHSSLGSEKRSFFFLINLNLLSNWRVYPLINFQDFFHPTRLIIFLPLHPLFLLLKSRFFYCSFSTETAKGGSAYLNTYSFKL